LEFFAAIKKGAGVELVVSQVGTAGKKPMDFFDWQGVRRQHGKPCNDEQRRQAEKATVYSRRFSLTRPSRLLKSESMTLNRLQICLFFSAKQAWFAQNSGIFMLSEYAMNCFSTAC